MKKNGLNLNSNHILGGFVDFLFCCDCCNNETFVVGEVKCPYKLMGRSVKENFQELVYFIESGTLNCDHSYYF